LSVRHSQPAPLHVVEYGCGVQHAPPVQTWPEPQSEFCQNPLLPQVRTVLKSAHSTRVARHSPVQPVPSMQVAFSPQAEPCTHAPMLLHVDGVLFEQVIAVGPGVQVPMHDPMKQACPVHSWVCTVPAAVHDTTVFPWQDGAEVGEQAVHSPEMHAN
jgi:hypothetical protein